MFSAFTPIPFSIAGVHAGLSEASGLARISSKGLILEYQVSLLSLLKLPVREINIPFSEITSVSIKKNFLQTSILVETSSLKTLATVPGSKTGQLRLRIARKDREKATRLVSALRLQLSEQALQSLTASWQSGLLFG